MDRVIIVAAVGIGSTDPVIASIGYSDGGCAPLPGAPGEELGVTACAERKRSVPANERIGSQVRKGNAVDFHHPGGFFNPAAGIGQQDGDLEFPAMGEDVFGPQLIGDIQAPRSRTAEVPLDPGWRGEKPGIEVKSIQGALAGEIKAEELVGHEIDSWKI